MLPAVNLLTAGVLNAFGFMCVETFVNITITVIELSSVS